MSLRSFGRIDRQEDMTPWTTDIHIGQVVPGNIVDMIILVPLCRDPEKEALHVLL